MGNPEEESTNLIVRQGKKGRTLQLRNFNEIWKLANVVKQSKVFGNMSTAEAATKIITGMEMGITPIRAIRHIDVIDGKPSVSGQLSAAMIREHPVYDYDILKANDELATTAIYKDGEEIGRASFTWEQAKNAGLARKNNWDNYREDMLVWRSIKRAKRRYCPEVGHGREYMPDELGEDEVPEADYQVVSEEGPESDPQPEPTPDENFTPKKTTTETKEKTEKSSEDSEDQTQEAQDHSQGSDSPADFDMEVTSDEEVEESSSSESKTETTGPDEEGDATKWAKFTKYLEKVDDGLSSLEGIALRNKIGEHHYRLYDNYEEDHKHEKFEEMLNSHIDRLDIPYNRKRREISPPTQSILNDIDESLQHLSGDDLEEQIKNHEGEAEEWSDPPREIYRDIISRHKSRLSAQRLNEEDEGSSSNEEDTQTVDKQLKADWSENINRMKTKLGMQSKDTIRFEPLQEMISAITEKAQEYGPEGYPTDEMLEQFKRAVAPYRATVQIRAAILDDTMDYETFNRVLDDFSDEIKNWDDKEAAKTAHDIVSNQAQLLEQEVEEFQLQYE